MASFSGPPLNSIPSLSKPKISSSSDPLFRLGAQPSAPPRSGRRVRLGGRSDRHFQPSAATPFLSDPLSGPLLSAGVKSGEALLSDPAASGGVLAAVVDFSQSTVEVPHSAAAVVSRVSSASDLSHPPQPVEVSPTVIAAHGDSDFPPLPQSSSQAAAAAGCYPAAAGDTSSGQLSAVVAPPGVFTAPPQSPQAGHGFSASTDPVAVCAVSSGATTAFPSGLSPVSASLASEPGVAAHPSLVSDSKLVAGGVKPSFANIVRVRSGPSFIRNHSRAVAAFGALPDIVAAPCVSSIEGVPSVFFSPEELSAAEDIFSDSIVLRFLSGRPTWEVCYSVITSWGLKQELIMGPLDSRSILLRFRDRNDMLMVLARESNYIHGFPYKAFRWNRQYNSKEDAAVVPVWVSFPHLPIPFFIPSMLRGIANSIGKFICFDRATSLMTRASSARVCIEMDLSSKPPSHVWIGVVGKFRQPIVYEKLVKFCNLCKIQGHDIDQCKKSPSDNSSLHGVYESLVHNHNLASMATLSGIRPENSDRPPLELRGDAPALISAPRLMDYSLEFLSSVSGDRNACLPDLLDQHPSISSMVLQQEVDYERTPSVRRNAADGVHESSDQSGYAEPTSTSSFIPVQARLPPHHAISPLSSSKDQSSLDQSSHIVKSGSTFGALHDCMTDLSNQHPPPLAMDLLQIAEQTRTPGVCRYAAAVDPAESDRPSFAELSANLDLAAEVATCHVSGLPTPSVSSPLLPSSASHQFPVVDRPCTPGARRNVASNQYAVSSSLSLAQAHRVGAVAVHPSSSSAPLSRANDSLLVDSGSQSIALSEALERLKKKVNYQPNDETVACQFDAFQEDSDDEDYLEFEAPYHSHMDDVHPHAMGYQSDDGRRSTKNKHIALSDRKINKRHPNAPLNAKLRSRKSSCPSTP